MKTQNEDFETINPSIGNDTDIPKISSEKYCKTTNKNFFCAIAASKSDKSYKFFGEDPNELTAKWKANRECFQKFNDCTIIYLGK